MGQGLEHSSHGHCKEKLSSFVIRINSHFVKMRLEITQGVNTISGQDKFPPLVLKAAFMRRGFKMQLSKNIRIKKRIQQPFQLKSCGRCWMAFIKTSEISFVSLPRYSVWCTGVGDRRIPVCSAELEFHRQELDEKRVYFCVLNSVLW